MNNSIQTPNAISLDTLQANIQERIYRVRLKQTRMALSAWKLERLISSL